MSFIAFNSMHERLDTLVFMSYSTACDDMVRPIACKREYINGFCALPYCMSYSLWYDSMQENWHH